MILVYCLFWNKSDVQLSFILVTMGFYLSELFVMVQLNQMEYSLKSILVYSHKWKKKTVFDIASRHNSAAKTAAASTNSGQSPAFRLVQHEPIKAMLISCKFTHNAMTVRDLRLFVLLKQFIDRRLNLPC